MTADRDDCVVMELAIERVAEDRYYLTFARTHPTKRPQSSKELARKVFRVRGASTKIKDFLSEFCREYGDKDGCLSKTDYERFITQNSNSYLFMLPD
jgi:hypothetical protein